MVVQEYGPEDIGCLEALGFIKRRDSTMCFAWMCNVHAVFVFLHSTCLPHSLGLYAFGTVAQPVDELWGQQILISAAYLL